MNLLDELQMSNEEKRDYILTEISKYPVFSLDVKNKLHSLIGLPNDIQIIEIEKLEKLLIEEIGEEAHEISSYEILNDYLTGLKTNNFKVP